MPTVDDPIAMILAPSGRAAGAGPAAAAGTGAVGVGRLHPPAPAAAVEATAAAVVAPVGAAAGAPRPSRVPRRARYKGKKRLVCSILCLLIVVGSCETRELNSAFIFKGQPYTAVVSV